MNALFVVACRYEVLDEKHYCNWFASPSSLEHDIRTTRRNIQDYRDAPRVIECQRFAHVNGKAGENFAKEVVSRLNNRYWFERDRADAIKVAIIDAEARARIYSDIELVQNNYATVIGKRDALRRLKKSLGEEAFIAGAVPLPLPEWAFDN